MSISRPTLNKDLPISNQKLSHKKQSYHVYHRTIDLSSPHDQQGVSNVFMKRDSLKLPSPNKDFE